MWLLRGYTDDICLLTEVHGVQGSDIAAHELHDRSGHLIAHISDPSACVGEAGCDETS